mmetsp:Transcript_767/g.2613  ORF Transcript_767/g.2613 Transcript_767/m.2613 type:complete len:361 (+) Transcript_767:742-1824(+)
MSARQRFISSTTARARAFWRLRSFFRSSIFAARGPRWDSHSRSRSKRRVLALAQISRSLAIAVAASGSISRVFFLTTYSFSRALPVSFKEAISASRSGVPRSNASFSASKSVAWARSRRYSSPSCSSSRVNFATGSSFGGGGFFFGVSSAFFGVSSFAGGGGGGEGICGGVVFSRCSNLAACARRPKFVDDDDDASLDVASIVASISRSDGRVSAPSATRSTAGNTTVDDDVELFAEERAASAKPAPPSRSSSRAASARAAATAARAATSRSVGRGSAPLATRVVTSSAAASSTSQVSKRRLLMFPAATVGSFQTALRQAATFDTARCLEAVSLAVVRSSLRGRRSTSQATRRRVPSSSG